ncbi:MAG: hypothetical protein M1833_003164 [Piccolia ochrophora]|nr:MAG: hypothetical protein M1833_003164 [Piccolia ochrophora]
MHVKTNTAADFLQKLTTVFPSTAALSGPAMATQSRPRSTSSGSTASSISSSSTQSSSADEDSADDSRTLTDTDEEAMDETETMFSALSLDSQMRLFPVGNNDAHLGAGSGRLEEMKNTPLFSAKVKLAAEGNDAAENVAGTEQQVGSQRDNIFPEYGLLAVDVESVQGFLDAKQEESYEAAVDPRIFVNVNTPWSAFICGSQGSGKSHTLSCLLENCLIESKRLGQLPKPLTGLVFHYDKFNSFSAGQVCEAAYLCSSGIPVKVLVSPSNFWNMQEAYKNMPNLPKGAPKPTVSPLYFEESQLTIGRMMRLMAVKESDGPMPLYIEVIFMILRQMAGEARGVGGVNYQRFKAKLAEEGLTAAQRGPLNLRLDLLESFMIPKEMPGTRKSKSPKTFGLEPGTLTIIDLSCPFVDEGSACVLFDICLGIFLERRTGGGRVIALDEAHKFMGDTVGAKDFTENLLSVIRLQRHLATRVIISTQEPTISPKLLDLCSMTFVHRFTSPDWLKVLKSHLAGASNNGNKVDDDESKGAIQEIFDVIVHLSVGEALMFSPSAMLTVRDGKIEKLGLSYRKVMIRKRLTADGGKSVQAE